MPVVSAASLSFLRTRATNSPSLSWVDSKDALPTGCTFTSSPELPKKKNPFTFILPANCVRPEAAEIESSTYTFLAASPSAVGAARPVTLLLPIAKSPLIVVAARVSILAVPSINKFLNSFDDAPKSISLSVAGFITPSAKVTWAVPPAVNDISSVPEKNKPWFVSPVFVMTGAEADPSGKDTTPADNVMPSCTSRVSM